jgi:hypothetical protein
MSRRGGCWPTSQQELLLRAALLRGPDGIGAWESWCNGVGDIMALDAGSIRMLPLLYHTLQSQQVDHPWMGRLRGTYRKAWYQNRMLLHHGGAVVRALAAAGLPTMVLKGAALAPTVYGDIAQRPMNDVDILVRTTDLDDAMTVFSDLGLRPIHSLARGRLELTHAVGFVDQTGRQIDLHWHVLEDDCRRDADAAFWANAVPAEIDGAETSTLDLTDQLFHTCAHGARWNRVPPYRWVADATTIMRSGGLDWDRLVDSARRHRVVPQLRSPLEYVVQLLGLDVPAKTMNDLESREVPGWLRREYRLKTIRETMPRRLALIWYQHRRLRNGAGGPSLPLSFFSYLMRRWGLNSAGDFVRFARVELAQRFGRKNR